MHFFVLNLDILKIFAFILQIFVLISGFFMVWNKKIAKRRDFGSFCSQNHVFLHNIPVLSSSGTKKIEQILSEA